MSLNLGVFVDQLPEPLFVALREAVEHRARLSAFADPDEAYRRNSRRPIVAPDGVRTLREVEDDHIMAALAACRGNRQMTANVLGIGERTLYRRLEQIDPDLVLKRSISPGEKP